MEGEGYRTSAKSSAEAKLLSFSYGVSTLGTQIAAAILVLLLVKYFFEVYKKNRRPGQVPTWPLIGSVPSLSANWHRLYDFITELSEKNDVVRVDYALGVEALYVAEPSLVEYMLKTNFANYPKGAPVKERMRELLGHGILASDGQQWKETRKAASFQFSSAILRDISADVFRERSVMAARIVLHHAREGKHIDMQDLFMRLTLDATCKVGFGIDLGCLSPSLGEVPFAKNFDNANELSFHRYVDPLWKLKKFLNVGNERALKRCVDAMDELCYDVIRKKRLNLKGRQDDGTEIRPDLLTRFITMTEGEAFSDRVLRDHVINFIMAGRDTTAITLSWFIYMTCKHPEVSERIFEELKCLEQDINQNLGACSNDPVEEFANVLTFYTVAKLHYLHATLTETLRLYPPVPMNGRIPEHDDYLPNGVHVKKGTLLAYSSYTMGRLERNWGPDAKDFKPERWLQDGVFRPESPFKFISFYAGPRTCLGKESAYLQMKITAALLIRFFTFELAYEQDIKPRVMFVLTMAEGVKVAAKPR